MKKHPAGFTLIEVMLAVAIFAFAVVGFGVALNEVLGVNSEIMRTTQRRQAIESVAAQILAQSNNFTASNGWEEVPGWGSETTWTLEKQVREVNIQVQGPNAVAVPLFGWWQVSLRSRDERKRTVDQISILLYGVR